MPIGNISGIYSSFIGGYRALPAIASAILWVPTAYIAHQWVEAGDGIAATHPTTTGDTVGQIDDASMGAHIVRSTSAVRSPKLAVGGGRGGSLKFGAASTAGNIIVLNSLSAFNIIHTTRTFTIAMWLKAATDGVGCVLLDNQNGTSANAGVYLGRTAANKLLFLICKASAGNVVLNYTSTATITVADGWVPITIVCTNGSGTLQIGDKTPESFTCNAGGATTVNAYANLVIGNDCSAQASAFNGWISDPAIWSTALDTTQLALYRSFDPPLSSASLASTSNTFNFLQTWWDASDTAYLWQDVSRTTQVVSDTDPVAILGNKTGQLLNRDAIQATAGLRPIWNVNITGGNAALRFNGTDSELNFAAWNITGAQTMFFVVKNLDDTYGSHFIIGDNDNAPHWAITGLNYSGNDAPGQPYVPLHCTGATTPGGAFDGGKLGFPTGFNIIEVVRNGSQWTTYMNGMLKNTYLTQAAAYNTFSRLGPAGGGVGTNWHIDGYICEYQRFTVAHSPARRALIRNGLGSKWQIPLN